MSNVVIRKDGKYLVEGSGFTGTREQATQYDADEAVEVQECAAAMGLGGSVVENVVEAQADGNIVQNPDGSSFAVFFVREKDLDGNGGVRPHRLNPSKRRFKTEAEAKHHGARFTRIEKHVTFYVRRRTGEPVNAWINQVTGKTNPEIGRARTNRD